MVEWRIREGLHGNLRTMKYITRSRGRPRLTANQFCPTDPPHGSNGNSKNTCLDHQKLCLKVCEFQVCVSEVSCNNLSLSFWNPPCGTQFPSPLDPCPQRISKCEKKKNQAAPCATLSYYKYNVDECDDKDTIITDSKNGCDQPLFLLQLQFSFSLL